MRTQTKITTSNSVLRMTQPEGMKTRRYVYGVEPLNGFDAWRLFVASAGGDLDEVNRLLKKDPRLVNAQYWYQFPIHMAVRQGHAKIVKRLLNQGADSGQSRATYNSWDKLLLCAQERGYCEIESLLQRAMEKRFNYSPEFEPLKQAILSADARRVRAIVRRHPELVMAGDGLGNNALHWSVIARQLKFIEYFADLGTPIDALRADGLTPVLLAANGAWDYWYRANRSRNHPSLRNASVMTGYLLAKGAAYTISVAAAIGDQERVEELLRKDPTLARRLDSSGGSPLSQAAREGHEHIVRLLLKRGAKPNAPENGAPDGLALFEACSRNHLSIAELLLEHGANPNAGLDSCGCCLTIVRVYQGKNAKPMEALLRRYGAYTPPYAMSVKEFKQAIRTGHKVIHHEEFPGNALRKRDRELLDLYLKSDAAIPQRAEIGDVVFPGSAAVVRRLLALGLDPNRPDWLGKTFLHACAEIGDRKSAAALLAAGADINARELEFSGTPLASAVRAWCGATDSQQETHGRKMVEFLLNHGATVRLPDDPDWAAPMTLAQRSGKKEIIELLKRHTSP